MKKAIWEAREQWRDIGRALNISDGTIRAIHEPNDGESLHEVLSQWIKSDKATIHDLLQALEDVTVNRTDIANQVRGLKGKDRTSVGFRL